MFAAIDVGSNTVRMLIGSISQGRLDVKQHFREVTRLGGGIDAERNLNPAAMARTLAALQVFSRELKTQSISVVRMVGTAALRGAANRSEFISRVAEQTGLDLQVISGSEEASLTVRGMLEALSPVPQFGLLMDIGGGSTEFALIESGRIAFRSSYPCGVVRLSEDFPRAKERRGEIRDSLETLASDLTRQGLMKKAAENQYELIGTAGTVTTLGAMNLQMEFYDWQKINNLILEKKWLTDIYQQLLPLTPEQREQIAGLEEGRGDLILPGLEIIMQVMKQFHKPRLRVSDFGLLEGILLSLQTPNLN